MLEELHKLLSNHSSSSTSVGRNVNVVALCGLGGTGKSSTAAEYCWLQENYYTSGVYWLSADFVDVTLREVAACLEEGLSQSHPERLTYAVMAKISRLLSPWLIVIDNVDSIEQLSDGPLKDVIFGNWKQSSAAYGAILVTTRCRPSTAVEALQLPSADNAVHLDVFSENEATEFVLKYTPPVEDSRDAAARLAKLLGCLPLALEQATSGIRSMKCKVSDYVKEYKKLSSRLMKKYKARKVDVNTSDKRLTVLTTWELNFRAIAADQYYGTVAGHFLKLAAYFGADRIPVELINNGLCQGSPIAEDIESPLHVRMMADLLTELSLFREDLPGRLRVHRLVQEVQRNDMRHNVDEMVKVFQAGVRTLHRALQCYPPPDTTKVLSSDERGSHTTWGMVAQHCLTFQGHLLREREHLGARCLSFVNFEFASIINTSAIYASAVGRQVQSKQLESLKFRLLNGLTDVQSSTSLLPLTIAKIPLGAKAQATVNRAIGTTTESSLIQTSNKQGVQKEVSAVAADDSTRSTERPKEPCVLPNEDQLLGAYSASETNMHSCQFHKAFESAVQCISLMPDRHEGYSRLAELFYLLNCSSLNLPRSAATMAMFLDSPCRKEKWFKDAYRDLKYVKVSSQAELQHVLKYQEAYANYVVILNGNDFVIDTFTIGQKMSFVALKNAHLSVFNECIVFGKASFIGVKLTVHKNSIFVFATAAVDFILCKLWTSSKERNSCISVSGSAYLERCVVNECAGGGLLVQSKDGSAVVMACTFARNSFTALEARHQGQLLAMNNKVYENRQGCILSPFPGRCLIKHNDIYLNSKEGVFYMSFSGMDMTPDLAEAIAPMADEKADTKVLIDVDSNLISENGSYGISIQQPYSIECWGVIRIRNNLVTANAFWGIFVDTPIGKDRFLVVEKNQIRRNRCGGIFVREFNSTRYIFEQNVVEDNYRPFGSLKQTPDKALSKLNIVRRNKGPGKPIDGPWSWLDPFCCRCHKEVKIVKDDTSAHFCKRCYSVRYCSKACLTGHTKEHSILCKFIRSKYSTVVQLSSPGPPSFSFCSGHRAFQKPTESEQLEIREGSRFVVKVRYEDHNPMPSQPLTFTLSSGNYLGTVECPDVFNAIVECGNMVPGSFSVKEMSCWAVAEDPGRSIRVFYDELASLKREK